jgi:hypothetical protein
MWGMGEMVAGGGFATIVNLLRRVILAQAKGLINYSGGKILALLPKRVSQ